jgi:Tfp pilus assembly protein PilZ
VIDLSVGGCCLQTELTPPPLGERVLLQLQFADRPLVIAGKVAWAEMGRRFGVMFDVVSSEQRARLVQQLKTAGMAEPVPNVP